MKKRGILFFLLVLSIQISLISATTYECSDNSAIMSNSEEISEGEVDSLSGLKIGVCSSLESSINQWIESIILIDANIIIIENSSAAPGIELKSSNGTVQYTSTNTDKATITLGGSTEELDLGDCTLLGGFVVMVKEIESPLVTVLVGNSKETLNTKQNSSKVVSVSGKTYAVTLLGGSSASSTLKVNWCRTGDLVQIEEVIIATNSTETTSTNESINEIIVEVPLPKVAECSLVGLRNGTQYCNKDGEYLEQLGNSDQCANDYECSSNKCKENICLKKSIFGRFVGWVKGIFS